MLIYNLTEYVFLCLFMSVQWNMLTTGFLEQKISLCCEVQFSAWEGNEVLEIVDKKKKTVLL